MTKAGIDYIRGIYRTAKEKLESTTTVVEPFSRGRLSGYHASTIDLCEAIAQFERFSLVEAGKGEAE